MLKKLILLSLLALLLTSCSLFRTQETQDYSHLFFDFKLSELASDRNAEYSSLCWYGDNLILLPQYPSYFRSKIDQDVIFMISQKNLSSAIKRKGKKVVETDMIKVVNNQVYKILPGYEGFEGICFDGEYFYLTVEYNSNSNQAVIVKARLSEDNKELEILNDEHLVLDLPANVFNASYESIFTYDNYIYVIYEANGTRINKNPIAKRISKDFQTVENISFEAIEYRITDVTSFDKAGKGWALNYFWSGDANHYLPDEDVVPNKFAEENNVDLGIERIIPLMITDNKIIYDKSRDPIYIKKELRDSSYNWEGIVTYRDNSFILVTDKFPKTELRFLKK